jgi:4-amino-4-deoxychorismate lyase
MCLFFESIRLEHGVFQNLRHHSERMNRTRRAFFHSADDLDLGSALVAPEGCEGGCVKCRVEYGRAIERIEFLPYTIQTIRTLQLVRADDVSYSFKFVDRSCFEKLKRQSDADEILILKNGLITDTSFSNVVFFDGQRWITPSTPLLEGTKRRELLEKGIALERAIRPSDLKGFSAVRCINAMRDIEDGDDIPVPHIVDERTPHYTMSR